MTETKKEKNKVYDTTAENTTIDRAILETDRFYLYDEMVNGTNWYFVGIKGMNAYVFCSQSKELCIREMNYYERFKNIDFVPNEELTAQTENEEMEM